MRSYIEEEGRGLEETVRNGSKREEVKGKRWRDRDKGTENQRDPVASYIL